MPEVLRLRKGWEFDELFRTGIRSSGELVRLLFLRDGKENAIKFGCAVGKRQGKAHVRSRGRRILREAFRQISGKTVPGLKIVLCLSEKGLNSKTQDIYRELETLFRRKKLLL